MAPQVYTRYRTGRSRRQRWSGLYWLLGLAGLGFLGWVFWRLGQPSPRVPPGPPPPLLVVTSPPPFPLITGVAPPTITAPPAPVLPLPPSALVLRTSPPPAAPVSTTLPPATSAVVLAPPSAPPPGKPPVGTSPPPSLVLRTAAPPPAPTALPRPVRDLFEAQIALARKAISPGSVDGSLGAQTRAALAAYQKSEGLPPTGELDLATQARLVLEEPPLGLYTVSQEDLARLHPLSHSWLGKSLQERLEYETIIEFLAERTCSHPLLVRRLNPTADWSRIRPGSKLYVPYLNPPEPQGRAASVRIHLGARALEALDENGRLMAHFPCSIARSVAKRPVGRLQVVVVARHPNYTFDPEVFPESEEAQQLGRKLILPPGPNNPVGEAWIGLDRPGYGIHGTPNPEEVGRTESHGCFRLANWNVEYLARLVAVGTPVFVEP